MKARDTSFWVFFFWIQAGFLGILYNVRARERCGFKKGVKYEGISLITKMLAPLVVAGSPTAHGNRCAKMGGTN